MSKKIMMVLGSPRPHGNSAHLLNLAAAAARKEGAEVTIVELGRLKTALPCTGCNSCTKSVETPCVLPDDLAPVIEQLRAADALLIATPVYWFNFTAQTKIFIDRAFYSLFNPAGPHALSGKKLGLIMVYGDKDPFASGAVNALRSFQDIASFIGARIAGMVYGSAPEDAAAATDKKLCDEAAELGKNLARDE